MSEPLQPPAPPEAHPDTLASRAGAALLRVGFVAAVAAFYRQHERYTPILFFFGGVGWDAATLRRIDALYDNLFLLGYLVLLGALILTATLVQYGKLRNPWLLRRREWLPAAIQFFMGALFSAYVIYYSQSASFSSTSFYLLLLVGLLVGNEFIRERLTSLYLLLGLYFLAAASFFIFFIPILTGTLGYATFLAGGVLSVLLLGGMLYVLHRRGVFQARRELLAAAGVVLGLFGLLNVFYVQNWIPPVPLALRHGGVFHNVARTGSGYALTYEQPAWYRFWVRSDATFRRAEGDAVYCFAAVFAPTDLKTRVYHRWMRYDDARGEWVQTDRIGYSVSGGRDGGFRGYTRKRSAQPGDWRVDVQTEDGRTIGRVSFTVVPAEGEPRPMKTLLYE